jgi:predicted ArsR family transcriptional regulator
MSAQAQRPRRRAVLEALRQASVPLGVADVAERVGVHPNTARFHLDALVAEGTVERLPAERTDPATAPASSPQPPAGPGRPRARYALRPGMDRGGVRGYRLLAEMLVSRLAAAGSTAAAEATEAGRAWGRYLVGQPPPYRRTTAAEAAERLTGLLAELGFAPEPTGARARSGAAEPSSAAEPSGAPEPGQDRDTAPDRIRLSHCPFLELAETYGPVVCPLHLGMIQGALGELGAPLAATRLEPFVEPDTCLVHLAPATAA